MGQAESWNEAAGAATPACAHIRNSARACDAPYKYPQLSALYDTAKHTTSQPHIRSRSRPAKLNTVCCTSLHAAARTVKAATSQLIAPAPNQARRWEGTTRRRSPPSPRCVPTPRAFAAFSLCPSPATLQSTPPVPMPRALGPPPRRGRGRDHHLRRGSWRVRRR